MSDCSNVMMRERLPEVLLGQLTPQDRTAVESQLSTCAECQEEPEILRTARAVMSRTAVPRIDTAQIVAALPKASRPGTRWRTAQRWRIAAAITFVALGGTSVATVVRSLGGGTTAVTDSGATVAPPVVVAVDSPRASGTTAVAVRLTAGGDVSDLADEDLEALIGALESIETAPHAEPQASRLTRLVPESTGGI